MMKEKNKKTALIALAAIVIASVFTVNAVAAQNLLTNPDAETGDMSGWTIIANGGNGWAIWGVDTTAYAGPYEGNHCFLTSYEWCKRSQEIDLLAKGYTKAQLDAAPIVNVEEWFGQANQYCRGRYYLKVELRDKDHNVIASWDSGGHWTIWRGSGAASWDQLSHEFSDYGSGLRYIYWEDGGKDENRWAGWYGAKLDAASLTTPTVTPTTVSAPAITPIGILALVGLLSIFAVSRIRRREK
jgi:hypothetical protein